METTPGKRVRQFREAKGYKSASAFAEAAGLKIATLSSIETDRTSPSFDILATLIAAFPDLNPDWLINGTGEMLRDGRSLTPIEAPAMHPLRLIQAPQGQTDLASRYIDMLERSLEDFKAREEDARAREEYWQQRFTELLGKSPGNPDSAGSYVPLPQLHDERRPIGFGVHMWIDKAA